MRKFTQGEWKVDKHLDIRCNGRFIAPISVTTGGKVETFCTSEDRANARLIVNAPKMYDILERLLTENVSKNEIIELLNVIDKAHRKLEKTSRPTKDEYYLNIAEAVMQRSTCLRRKYGAVIVKNDEIISTGYNGSPRGEENCCDTGKCWREEHKVPHGEQYEKCCSSHGEMNAIISASRKDMIGATLYLASDQPNAEPCDICRRLIKNAGIERVVTREQERKY